MMLAVMSSMLGEVIGDEIQNAMTGASGRPRRRRIAMMGSAPSPHTGVMEPTKLAITTARTGPPESQESARSDQLPRVRAPASTAATATTGSNAIRPSATAIDIPALGSGSSEPAASMAAVTSHVSASAFGLGNWVERSALSSMSPVSCEDRHLGKGARSAGSSTRR